MAIIMDENSRTVIQGITGQVGTSFAARMVKRYPNLVGGVSPGKGGQQVCGLPVFDSVSEAVEKTSANTSLIVVPAPFVKDAVLEAADTGVSVIWIYTDNVPIHEVMVFVQYCKLKGITLVGPNSAGVVSPGKASASELNEDQLPLVPGPVGIVSKSGSLTYEVIDGLGEVGLGESTILCLGGDPVLGTSYLDALRMFEKDSQTRLVVLLGEIGGTAEVDAAAYISSLSKPVVAYICGHIAPPGKKMGHAGAIVSRNLDTAGAKSRALREAGAIVADLVTDIPALVLENLTAMEDQTVKQSLPMRTDQETRRYRRW